ncbi:MAG: 50S ribosomal protein L22 [Parcubacteria group bacterium]|nr:50S ribosomal protein L22 [Parcubacteria group bacterium]
MSLEVKAKLSSLRISPRKVRLVADLMRGKKVEKTIEILSLLNKKATMPLLKLLKSATANAKHNHSLSVEDLRISKITVNEGPFLKRWMPRARGRATMLRKRSSHVALALESISKKKDETTNEDQAKQKEKKIEKSVDKKAPLREVEKKTKSKNDKKKEKVT